MRHKTVTILKMEGFEVLEAADGAEGIRLALEELPDLVLCDIMMPAAMDTRCCRPCA
jgi:CheY-like chemotaxis protein